MGWASLENRYKKLSLDGTLSASERSVDDIVTSMIATEFPEIDKQTVSKAVLHCARLPEVISLKVYFKSLKEILGGEW